MFRGLSIGAIPLPLWEGEGVAGGAAGAADAGAAADKGGAAADKGGEVVKAPPTALAADAADKQVVAPADWPDTWRDLMAGNNADARKRLDRYRSPADVAAALDAAQTKISKGIKSDMPDPADVEAMKAWRKDNDIPEAPDAYVIPDKVKALITDEDKPVVTAFTEEMHKRNWSNKQVADTLEWFYDYQDGVLGAQTLADRKHSEETQDALRQEWGREFKANKEAAQTFAKEIMGDLPWEEARLPTDPALGAMSGRRLGDIPDFVKALVTASTKVYGDTSLVGGDAIEAASARKAALEEKMKTNEFTAADRKELTAIIEAEQKRQAARR